jgi:Rod binding domain-containing protein
MHPVSNAIDPGATVADGAKARRVLHAAHEFEAVLLNTLLGSLEHSFASLPGKDPEASSDNYQYLGMQALASSLAARGGVGIASMIVRSLFHPGSGGANSQGQQTKVSLPSADKPR